MIHRRQRGVRFRHALRRAVFQSVFRRRRFRRIYQRQSSDARVYNILPPARTSQRRRSVDVPFPVRCVQHDGLLRVDLKRLRLFHRYPEVPFEFVAVRVVVLRRVFHLEFGGRDADRSGSFLGDPFECQLFSE